MSGSDPRSAACAALGRPADVLVRSPGRVNLIGEHTDYNDGFVLPLAIEPAVWLAAARRDDGRVRVTSRERDEVVELDPADPGPGEGWGAYVRGMLGVLAASGRASPGFDAAVASDLPVGASLSSSAALELGVARVAVALGGGAWEPDEMAALGMEAENDWVGVSTGIMDQLACAGGVAGHAVLIDCRSRALEPVPLPEGVVVAVLDTGTRRELVGSEYDARRADCEQAARRLGVPALRDATPTDVTSSDLPPRLRARARHVVTEDVRTLTAADALRAGDLATVGAAMAASHASLRDDYEVSTNELDAMVAAADAAPGVVGARMTGGGFGGAAVALVERGAIDAFTAAVRERYRAECGRDASVLVTAATDGTAVVDAAG